MSLLDERSERGGSSESWLDRWLSGGLTVTPEILVFALILVLAALTRLTSLEPRVMSHDESLHTYYSYQYEQGRGYEHTPLMHGPLQFHLVGLSYFLFGDSDASAHLPAALAGVAAIALVWVFRRWLGRTGMLLAAAMLLFSPYILYYSRYVRNESFVVLEALLMFWAVFRYTETRETRWLLLLSASLALHASTKETYFIYAAQLLLFLGGLQAWELIRRHWEHAGRKVGFLVGLGAAVVGAGLAVVMIFRERASIPGDEVSLGLPLDPTAGIAPASALASPLLLMGMLLAVLGAALVLVMLILEFGRRLSKDFPLIDLLVIAGSVTLPQLSSMPARAFGWDPLAYTDPASYTRTGIVILVLLALSAAIGLIWDWRRWLPAVVLFWAIYIPLYSSLFTNGPGILSGIVGSLGYWLVQHGVERGSQPEYYYIAVQIPLYEYLPALGALLAVWVGVFRGWGHAHLEETSAGRRSTPRETWRFPIVPFLGYWAVTSIFAYSYAGERMPWLTVHMALSLILFAAWGLGTFLDDVPWRDWLAKRAWVVAAALILLLLTVPRAVGYLLGSPAPFQGSEMSQLKVTTGLLGSLIVAFGGVVVLVRAARKWTPAEVGRLLVSLFFGLLYALTVRTAIRAAFVHPDDATEFLVYAHSAPGVKTLLRQVEDLSLRMTDGLNIDVAYDDDVSWPFSWYLRNYTHPHFYGPNPTRELLNYPVIIAGDNTWAKIEPLLGDRYYVFEYIRMWWPMQEYWNLTWERIRNAWSSPEYRAALWQIWFNRDFTLYGQVTGVDYSLKNWNPSDRMKLFVRKDVVSQVWDYGVAPASLEPVNIVDPYEAGMQSLAADIVVGQLGNAAGQFSSPRSVAVAPDGSLYIADTANHRIQHLSADGTVLQVWGKYANAAEGEAPAGTFNEPWGVAVAPDGTVYVADTWNHRVQHFSADGKSLGMFGSFGQAESPSAFWGPRAVAVDGQGRVYVADTGNKRVLVFTADGQPVGQIGSPGYASGQLDEPVGVAVGADGRVFVADTWNQRVQVFEEGDPGVFLPAAEWSVDAWFGQSLDNKPYLAVSRTGEVCISDPEGYRILCFNQDGEFLRGWGDFGMSETTFDLPAGLAFDSQGQVWVVDVKNARLMRFPAGG